VQYLAAEKLDAMIEEIKAMFLSGRTVGGQLFLDFKNGLRKSHAALSTEAKADVEALIERLETEKRLSANAEEDGADAGKFTPRFVSPFLANN
jgi:hypothetical protein